jgi:DHA1 family tetracycline resistance protein-like MFS transporter
MKTKPLILFTIFIDVLGIGIIIPVLPFYVRSFGVSDAVVTILFATYALLSFMSAPFLGALSDKIGRRPVLIGSIISTAIGWLVFAKAKTVTWLFLGRIIDGFAAGNITTAQTLLADIAKDDKERTVNMGLFGAIFGVGFIVGPAIGGLLAHWGTSTPFWFVGILAAINALLAYFFLPETHHTKHTDKIMSLNPFKPIIDGFKNKEMRLVFFVWLLFGVALSVQQGTFALYVNKLFGMNATQTSLLFGAIGIMILINQMVLLKKVWLKHFHKKALALIMLVTFGVGMIMQSVPMLVVFLVGMIFATIGQGNLRTVFGSIISSFNPDKRGEYLGISTAIMSLAMIIGPLVATVTYINHPALPFIIAGALSFIGWWMMRRFQV